MKPIHECAVIKDGNKRVAYMISEADSHVNITSKPWKIVDASTFENMVANNKVQYLVWENNTIKCRYDLDELKLLKKDINTRYDKENTRRLLEHGCSVQV